LGAIVAIAAIIITIILYRKQVRNKGLSYEILSSTPLLSVDEELRGDVEILYRGKSVEDVHLILFKLVSSGSLPILATDFVQNVRLSLGKEAQPLTAEIVRTHPKDLGASISVEGNEIVFDKLLMNPEDSVEIRILVNKFVDVSVNGRIAGVKVIREYEESEIPFAVASCGFVLVLLGAIGMLSAVVIGPMGFLGIDFYWFMLSFVIGYVILFGKVISIRFARAIHQLLRKSSK